MPYRTDALDEEREKLAAAWHRVQDREFDLYDEQQALARKEHAERARWSREARSALRRAGALLLWTFVLGGWAGLNASWSRDLDLREPAAVSVVMPADFCAPAVIDEHRQDMRAQTELFGFCDDSLVAAEIERDALREQLAAHTATCNDAINQDYNIIETCRLDWRAARRECRRLGGCGAPEGHE